MKRLSIILLTSIFSVSAFNQIPQQDIFTGTWKYQNGNEVFLVALWKTTDGYKGHYKKILVDANGNQISVVYDSNKPIGNSTTNWPFVIYAGNFSQDYEIGAIVTDNSVTNTPNGCGFIDGYLDMKILNPQCYTPRSTCSLQAQWKVKKRPGLQHPDEPPFKIPTDIVLIKQ